MSGRRDAAGAVPVGAPNSARNASEDAVVGKLSASSELGRSPEPFEKGQRILWPASMPQTSLPPLPSIGEPRPITQLLSELEAAASARSFGLSSSLEPASKYGKGSLESVSTVAKPAQSRAGNTFDGGLRPHLLIGTSDKPSSPSLDPKAAIASRIPGAVVAFDSSPSIGTTLAIGPEQASPPNLDSPPAAQPAGVADPETTRDSAYALTIKRIDSVVAGAFAESAAFRALDASELAKLRSEIRDLEAACKADHGSLAKEKKLLHAAAEIARLHARQGLGKESALAENEVALSRARVSELVSRLYKSTSRLMNMQALSLKHIGAVLRERALKVPERDEIIMKLQVEIHRTRKILKESVRQCMQKDNQIAEARREFSRAHADVMALQQRLRDAEHLVRDADSADEENKDQQLSRSSSSAVSVGKARFQDAVQKVQNANRVLRKGSSAEETTGSDKMAFVVLSAQLQDTRKELSERNRQKVDLIMEMGWLRAELDAQVVERDKWKARHEELEQILEQTEEQLEECLGRFREGPEDEEESDQPQDTFSLSSWVRRFAGMADASAPPDSSKSPRSSPRRRVQMSTPERQPTLPTISGAVPTIDQVEPGQEWKRSLSRRPRTGTSAAERVEELTFTAQPGLDIGPTEGQHPRELAAENARLQGMIEELRANLLEKEDIVVRAKESATAEANQIRQRLVELEQERDQVTDRAAEFRDQVRVLQDQLAESETKLRIRTIQYSARIADAEARLHEAVQQRTAQEVRSQSSLGSAASSELCSPEAVAISVSDVAGTAFRVEQPTVASVAGSLHLLAPSQESLLPRTYRGTGSADSLVSAPGAKSSSSTTSPITYAAQSSSAPVSPTQAQPPFLNDDAATVIAKFKSQLAIRDRMDAHRQRELDSITKEFDRVSLRLADLEAERRGALQTCAAMQARIDELEAALAKGWDADELRTWEDLRRAFSRRLEIKEREIARLRGDLMELTRLRDEMTVGKCDVGTSTSD
ncbi:hypothetical protein DFJ74DRAFT_660457 [Hyaloraphidium curvatum]|nr:hypothetical protein DFJ74DRAFT_660457 [Hyaloraphidium curvatum]